MYPVNGRSLTDTIFSAGTQGTELLTKIKNNTRLHMAATATTNVADSDFAMPEATASDNFPRLDLVKLVAIFAVPHHSTAPAMFDAIRRTGVVTMGGR
jgi:hypothetical protein